MYHDITMAAMTAAEKSEIGILYHTPSMSHIIGRKARSGRRMSNCLDKERKMLILHLSDALEEVGDDHLEPDDREAEHHYSDSLDAPGLSDAYR